MRLFLAAFVLSFSLTASAVDQPVFDSKTQLLAVPSVKLDGVPYEGVLRLSPNGTYQILQLDKLFNCPINGFRFYFVQFCKVAIKNDLLIPDSKYHIFNYFSFDDYI